jgi:DNA-binding MarR family transcriptional regulator
MVRTIKISYEASGISDTGLKKCSDRARRLNLDKSTLEIVPLNTQPRCKEMLISLRKIIQAISLHSKDLSRRYGLTGPQLVILNDIAGHQALSVTQLARSSSLSQATVTDILNRLEKRELVERTRDDADRRRVMIRITDKGRDILSQAPPPLQEMFVSRYTHLAEWEQLMILSALKRIVELMSANELDAAPFLMTEELWNEK